MAGAKSFLESKHIAHFARNVVKWDFWQWFSHTVGPVCMCDTYTRFLGQIKHDMSRVGASEVNLLSDIYVTNYTSIMILECILTCKLHPYLLLLRSKTKLSPGPDNKHSLMLKIFWKLDCQMKANWVLCKPCFLHQDCNKCSNFYNKLPIGNVQLFNLINDNFVH